MTFDPDMYRLSPDVRNRKHRVIIVDDDRDNLDLLRVYIERIECDIVTCSTSIEAKEHFNERQFDLAILDVMMPGITGIELCKWIKSDPRTADCCVIFSTAAQTEDILDEALEAGGMDYLEKPLKSFEIIARAKSALRYKQIMDERHRSHVNMHSALFRLKNKNEETKAALEQLNLSLKDIKQVQETVLFSMSKLAESRDNETGKHLMRTRAYVELIAKSLQKNKAYSDYVDDEYIESLALSAPLHDIGKVGIPDAILRKKGKLTIDEYEVMKTHVNIGADTLIEAANRVGHRSFLELAIQITRSHHELNDGSGYPEGLSDDDIPLAARIMSIADVYDALRSKRCYKVAMPHEQAWRIIVFENGVRFFHPDVLDAFVENEKEFIRISEQLMDDG